MVPTQFTPGELIDLAISIERRGIAFYDVMGKSTENAAAREVFQYLTAMEREHLQIFQGMLAEAEKRQSPSAENEEHTAYLQTLVDTAVFSDDLITSEMATQTETDIRAIELAISAEKDSILFYYELRESMPGRAHATVNRILAEEKSHLKKLSDLKKKLTAS